MEQTDTIIIGSGIAGLRAAIELVPAGQVTVLTKSKADESNTEYAQGGIAVALSDEDQVGLHLEDTLKAGDGLCDEKAVAVLVSDGPDRIVELIQWGTDFDRDGARLAFTREAAHSRKRILHAHGDSTGKEIIRTLLRKVQSLQQVRLIQHAIALELIVDSGACRGVRYLDEKSGEIHSLHARAVLLCTGGLGQIYPDTTNPDIATGDGCALALRAGAALMDMEFMQFHPTALCIEGAPRFLLSEALRGEGAVLRNSAGERFMTRYHADGELAPRDVVSRSMVQEIQCSGGREMFLDMTHLDGDFLKRRFPKIFQTCLSFGFDLSRQPVPVHPAAHYMMGGVLTDTSGRTTVPRLLAAGEVACTGVHGANRLASNSLLEGLVFGHRAGRAIVAEDWEPDLSPENELETMEVPRSGSPVERGAVQRIMRNYVGIIRSRQGLEQALQQLARWTLPADQTPRNCEDANLLELATVMAAAALRRQESRGAHFREDFPRRDDERWRRNIVVRQSASSGLVFSLM